jgi:hypothetical protein
MLARSAMIFNRIGVICIAVVMAFECSAGRCQAEKVTQTIRQGGKTGNVPMLLAYIATIYHIPLVAEVVYSGERISVPAGSYTAQAMLDLASRAASVEWNLDDDVVHVFDTRLRDERWNYLNHRPPHFSVPNNVADLQLQIEDRINTAQAGLEDKAGGVEGGFHSGITARELVLIPLAPELLNGYTVQDILLKEAAAGGFYSIVVFPHLMKTKGSESDWNYVSLNWFWGSIKVPLQSDLAVETPTVRRAPK